MGAGACGGRPRPQRGRDHLSPTRALDRLAGLRAINVDRKAGRHDSECTDACSAQAERFIVGPRTAGSPRGTARPCATFGMEAKGSITHWIHAAKAGDEEAAQKLWERYFERLVRLARGKTRGGRPGGSPTKMMSPSRPSTAFAGERGRSLPRLQIATSSGGSSSITAYKALDQIKHEHREKRGGKVVGAESFARTTRTDATTGGSDRKRAEPRVRRFARRGVREAAPWPGRCDSPERRGVEDGGLVERRDRRQSSAARSGASPGSSPSSGCSSRNDGAVNPMEEDMDDLSRFERLSWSEAKRISDILRPIRGAMEGRGPPRH